MIFDLQQGGITVANSRYSAFQPASHIETSHVPHQDGPDILLQPFLNRTLRVFPPGLAQSPQKFRQVKMIPHQLRVKIRVALFKDPVKPFVPVLRAVPDKRLPCAARKDITRILRRR